MTNRRLALVACASLLLGACQAQNLQMTHSPLDLQTLHRSSHCGTEQASLRAVPDQASLDRILTSGMLGVQPQLTADFARQSVFQLSMGQQPTAGASIGVTSASIDSAARRLTVNAVWQLPDPGRMQAMVITQPCVIFSVSRGDYRAARVVDAQQQERLVTDLNPAR